MPRSRVMVGEGCDGEIHRRRSPAALLRRERPRRINRPREGTRSIPVCKLKTVPVPQRRSARASRRDGPDERRRQAAADGRHRRRDLAVRRPAAARRPRRTSRAPSTRSRAYPTSFRPPPPLTCSSSQTLYELVWASGWEERANEHLPHLLGHARRAALPALRARGGGRSTLARALEARGDRRRTRGARPLAWIDDALDERLPRVGGSARAAPTLLVQTEPEHGPHRPRGASCWSAGRWRWRGADGGRGRHLQRFGDRSPRSPGHAGAERPQRDRPWRRGV